MKRYFSAFALTVILVRGVWAQGDRSDQALRDLKPLAERLLKALDENDFDASNKASEEIARALQKSRPVPVSKKAMLAELEASVEGDRIARASMLAEFALLAEEAEENEKARQYASEALEAARKGGPLGSGPLGSRNTYYGNLVLGLLALREQNPHVAGRLLLTSLDSGVWPTFDLLGPNLKLGKRLLEARETEVVVEYLERCKRYWPSGRQRLKDWQAVIRAGGIPDFSVNGLR